CAQARCPVICLSSITESQRLPRRRRRANEARTRANSSAFSHRPRTCSPERPPEGHMDALNLVILVGASLVLVSILTSLISFRVGAPLLLVFLGVGLGAGEDGLGIIFDD